MVYIDRVYYWIKLNKNYVEMEGYIVCFIREIFISGYDCGEEKLFVFFVYKGNDDYKLSWEYVRFFLFYCFLGNIIGKFGEIF